MKILELLPENISEMKINKIHAESIMKLLEHMDMSIILYGVKDSGKKTIIQCVMNTLLPHCKISECPVTSSSNEEEKVLYKLNNYYIEINCNSVRSKNKQSILNIIKRFCSSMSFGDDGNLRKRIVIIHDIDILHKQIQYSLRRLMEVYTTCIFIFTTCSINKIIDSLQSRCSCYRLPINKKDISELLSDVSIKDNGISNTLLAYDGINYNINNYKVLIDFINKNTISIPTMRNSLYDILSCNIKHNEIIKHIVSNLKFKTPEIQHKIIELAADVDIMCIEGSKDIINLEYFVISCKVLFSNKK